MLRNHLIKIFVVEDDVFYSTLLSERLNMEDNIEVTVFSTAKEFLENLFLKPDIAVIDYNLPDKNGLEILTAVKQKDESIACILLSGQKTVEVVVDSYNLGAHRYIIKNEDAMVELLKSIENISSTVALRKEVEVLQDQIIDRHRYQSIVGESPAIMKVLRLIQKVENINMDVLVTGNSGTGKELVAQAIHYNSDRRRKPFVAVNIAAIPEDLLESELFGHEKGAFTGASGKRVGKFELANNGTIFLDEIGEMDINLQTKLLRVLQERKVSRLGSNKEIDLNVKVVAATNKNLWEESQKGNFREDLYFRLQGFLIDLPPLAERGNDVVILAKHFIKLFCEQQKATVKSLHPETIKDLISYDWPGNIRELKSMVERASLICDGDVIMPDDLIFPYNFKQMRVS